MNRVLFRRALVTGATGFIGSHLVRRLVLEGWQVHIVVRHESMLCQLKEAQGRVLTHQYDGTTERMIAIMREVQPDMVFHLASLFIAEHNPQDVAPLILSNLLMGTQLLEAMKQVSIKCLVNTGTAWQHYEDRDYSPVCLYAATKQAFEAVLQYYNEAVGIRSVTLKLFDTYGPEDSRPKLFHLLAKVLKEQMPLAMSPGEQYVDFVYIDDVVNAFMVAANRLHISPEPRSEIYAVSSGEPIKLKELVALYGKFAGTTLPIQWGGRPYRLREVMMPWKLGGVLPGWHPQVGLAEGISRTLSLKNPGKS